jgi:hypothetical protein
VTFRQIQSCSGLPFRCRALASDPEVLLLTLDCRNAFNTVSRATISKAVAPKSISFMPFLRWACGGLSRIFVQGAPHNTDPIYATSGSKQIDPLGPLLFVIALMGPLRTVAAAHPEAHVVACIDDINVVGPADSAVCAFDRLTTEVLSVGLTTVPTKCALHGPNTDVAPPQSWALRTTSMSWLSQTRLSVPRTL